MPRPLCNIQEVCTSEAYNASYNMDRGGDGCGYEEFADAQKAFRLGASLG